MKINLLVNSNDVRSGYTNIDPFASPTDTQKVIGNVYDLDEYVDDGEAIDLLALDVIDYVSPASTDAVLDIWIKKIRHGGTITIGGIDMREISHAFLNNKISLTEANILLYGAQRAPYEYRKATLTIQHVINMFKERGFKLERKQIIQYHYYVTARRP